ncbi:MAG: ABC-2 transporter permease [Lactobacillales bacterium]|jgi:hypothetical protein|nr:ABC-2 transporter permease [Lactobacillales bacterium]
MILKALKLNLMMTRFAVNIKRILMFIVINIGIVAVIWQTDSKDINAGFSSGVGMLLCIGSVNALSLFAVIDKNKMEDNFVLLGIKRAYTVAAQYVYSLLMMTAFGIASSAVYIVTLYVLSGGKTPFDTAASTETFATTLALEFVLIYSIQLVQSPMFFWLGYEKAAGLQMIPMVALGGIYTLIAVKFPHVVAAIAKWYDGTSLGLMIVEVVVVMLVLIAISYAGSTKLYTHRLKNI